MAVSTKAVYVKNIKMIIIYKCIKEEGVSSNKYLEVI